MKPRTSQFITIMLGGGVAFAPFASADLLEFRAGGSVRLAATLDGDTVRIDAPSGELSFARGDFRKITPEPWPERDWPARAKQAQAGTTAQCYEAARWAWRHGLTQEAARMLEEADAADPNHAPTARLCAVLRRLAKPSPDPDIDAVTRLLPSGYEIERGPHVILFHRAPKRAAEDRVAFLEQVLTSFYLEFSALGIDLTVPQSRLPVIWFPERRYYEAFLRAERADAFLTTRGYYHPTRRLVATYDARGDQPLRQRMAAFQAEADRLVELRGRIDGMSADSRLPMTTLDGTRSTLPQDQARHQLSRMQRDLERRRLLFEITWRQLDLTIAAHELLHQLVAASGLAPHYEDFPIWLHEGLAMQFEGLRGGRWGGLETVPEARLSDWKSVASEAHLAAVLRDQNLTHGYDRKAYAQAWAWVFYMRHQHPQTWEKLLHGLRVPDGSGRSANLRGREILLHDSARTLLDWERDWREQVGQIAEQLSPMASKALSRDQ